MFEFALEFQGKLKQGELEIPFFHKGELCKAFTICLGFMVKTNLEANWKFAGEGKLCDGCTIHLKNKANWEMENHAAPKIYIKKAFKANFHK